MSTRVSEVQVQNANQYLFGGVRKGVKFVLGCNPQANAILHFAKNVYNGNTLGKAASGAVTQTIQDCKNNINAVVDYAKPRDKVEVVMSHTVPTLIPTKRAVVAATKSIVAQWNSLPTLDKK